MADPFKPKHEQSYRDMLVAAIRELPTGRVIAHDDPSMPFRLNERNGDVQRAIKELERVQGRTLAPVRGVGYKIVEGIEHLTVAENSVDKARRQAETAFHRVATVNTKDFSGPEQARYDDTLFRALMLKRARDSTRKRQSPEEIIARARRGD